MIDYKSTFLIITWFTFFCFSPTASRATIDDSSIGKFSNRTLKETENVQEDKNETEEEGRIRKRSSKSTKTKKDKTQRRQRKTEAKMLHICFAWRENQVPICRRQQDVE